MAKAKPAARSAKKRSTPKMGASMQQATNVPFVSAVTVRQTAIDRAITITGSDILAKLSYTSTSPVGVPSYLRVNPLMYPRTRLGGMAQNYTKYRFRKAVLRMFTNQATNVGGNFIIGYCENPDQEFSNNAPEEVFALTGASIVPVYVPQHIPMAIKDRAKWYNLDLDSEEIMNTEQGMFVIMCLNPVPATTPIDLTFTLDYTLELSGAARQVAKTGLAVSIFPSVTFTSTSAGISTLAVAAGETVPFPTMLVDQPYLLVPATGVPIDLQGGTQEAEVIVKKNATNYSYFETFESWSSNKPLILAYVPDLAARTFPRTTVTQLN